MERKRRKNCCGWTFCFGKSSLWKTEVGSSYAGWYRLSAGLETGTKEKRTCFICFPGKQIRAIELVLTLKESTFLPDTSYRAVIDKKQNVYVTEGVIEPEEDGSNRTPAGLKVDKNGKFSIDEQRGMEK